MRRLALILVPILGLAACGHKETQETQTTVTKDGVTTTTITKRVIDRNTAHAANSPSALSIDANDFKANVEIPGLAFGGEHMNLDGMKLYPGSKVTGMHVHANNQGNDERGQVVMNYSSPAAPAVVAPYMADQARKAGFSLTSNTTALIGGSKRENRRDDRIQHHDRARWRCQRRRDDDERQQALRRYPRWRISASCATLATSVPPAAKI